MTDTLRSWPALQIGDTVLDADGRHWEVLNRPDGARYCDGLFLAKDGNRGQRYGEHMAAPVVRVEPSRPVRPSLRRRSAWHELRCAECRVSWRGWLRRLRGGQ